LCCEGEETCYDIETKDCCDELKIYDIATEKCCNEDTGHTCEKSPVNKTCCDGECCDPCECESCIGGTCEYVCTGCCDCDGQGYCVKIDSNCDGVQKCITGCECICDDSGNSTVSAACSVSTEPFEQGIKNAVEAIKVVDIDASVSASISGQVNKRAECCDIEDTQYTDHYWGSAGLSMTASADFDLLNIPDFKFEKTWAGKGYIKAEVDIDLGPSVEASASGSITGDFKGCPDEAPCWHASGSLNGTLGIQAQGKADLEIKTYTGWGWFDDLFSFKVVAEATGEASVGASAAGTYYDSSASNCSQSGSGFEVGCVKIGGTSLTATLTFKIGEVDFSVSASKDLFDGWNNGKCG